MIVQIYNRKLEKYSQGITKLRLIRSNLKTKGNESIYLYLTNLDKDGKGYLTKQEIIKKWLPCEVSLQQSRRRFLQRFFDFQKISYSVIVNFLTATQSQNHQEISQLQIGKLISNTFETSFCLFCLEQEVAQKMDKFIPMKYSRPSEEELTRYALCQAIAIDVKQMAKYLNLLESHPKNTFQQDQSIFDKTLSNPSVTKMQDIMNRLQRRVTTMGSQWIQN